jgi:ABC-type multidrug transport system fused ATPase/permease subunit
LLELKLFQNLQDFQGRLGKLFSKFHLVRYKNEKIRVKRLILAQTSSQFTYALVGVFFVYQVTQGNLMIGTLTFLITTVGRFRNSLSGFFFSLSSQYQDGLFVSDFFELKEMPSWLSDPSEPIVLGKSSTPKIEFVNVSFKYPGTKHMVLRNINLTIEPGTKLALVGNNGAGKTTFVKLLCRFYDVTSGEILIDGHNIKDIDLDSWYWHMGILFQEYARYNFLVKDSIKVGRTADKGKGRVLRASRQAEAHDFIKEWPNKYRQQLGREFSDGVEPSIGQWQKLALARVFYRNPSIFILDEPTASLDAEAEFKVFAHLDLISALKTTIFISHRFSTVRKADKIIVIQNGRLTEEGSHRELLVKDRTYARLYNLQARDYKD